MLLPPSVLHLSLLTCGVDIIISRQHFTSSPSLLGYRCSLPAFTSYRTRLRNMGMTRRGRRAAARARRRAATAREPLPTTHHTTHPFCVLARTAALQQRRHFFAFAIWLWQRCVRGRRLLRDGSSLDVLPGASPLWRSLAGRATSSTFDSPSPISTSACFSPGCILRCAHILR